MWRATDANGALLYPFIDSLIAVRPFYLIRFLSGLLIWEVLWPNSLGWAPAVWSIAYNGSYMVPEMVITSIVAALSYKPLKRYWLGEDLKAPKAI